MLSNPNEALFVHKYLIDYLQDGVSIGKIYKELFEPEGTEDIRVYVGKAKKLIKTKRCKEEVARLQARETCDVDNPEAIKNFVAKELLDLYVVSSSVIPAYDRNGHQIGRKMEFMDSSVLKNSIELLGKSVGMFKEVNENKNEDINITLDGADIKEKKSEGKIIKFN